MSGLLKSSLADVFVLAFCLALSCGAPLEAEITGWALVAELPPEYGGIYNISEGGKRIYLTLRKRHRPDEVPVPGALLSDAGPPVSVLVPSRVRSGLNRVA